MTPEAQRIAIAEWCGLPVDVCMCGDSLEATAHRTEHPYTPMCSFDEIPDYLNDLNGMHEAEGKLNDEQREDYVACLTSGTSSEEVCDLDPLLAEWNLLNATAAQRAEALLRTLNLWKD